MRLIQYFFGLLLISLWTITHAMQIEVRGDTVFASGPVENDSRKFDEAFSSDQIKTVVFVNSPGGDLWTALYVGRLIAQRGINTVIAGTCISACSIMFMGGKERRFSGAFRPNLTYIGIHGGHNRDTQRIDPQVQPQIFAYYKQHMGEKFNDDVMNKALYDMKDAGALLYVLDSVRSTRIYPYHCASGQMVRDKCTEFPDHTAITLGIVTHNEFAEVDLPVKFKTAATLFGKPLETWIPDLHQYYADLGSRQCADELCKRNTLTYLKQPENRAVAVPLQGLGYRTSLNADSLDSAMLQAVYACNHTVGKEIQLCEPEVVNQYDIRPLYAAAKAEHTAAFEKLTLPTEKYYANEEYGGGFSTASSLRTEGLSDITPQKIEGVTTVGTQALVQRMLSPKPPIVIDVFGAFETIPNSLPLINGGAALGNAASEAGLEMRIKGLLRLLAPDKTASIAFFCAGRNCWSSVNAALRATKLGYTNVLWYRGGLESWRSAGLPTATIVLRAVAY